jgi:hypothetical protein
MATFAIGGAIIGTVMELFTEGSSLHKVTYAKVSDMKG